MRLTGLILAAFLAVACGSGAGTAVMEDVGSADFGVDSGVDAGAFDARLDLPPELPLEVDFELTPVDLPDFGYESGPGEPGYPCESGADCNEGFCIQTAEGMQCTQTCEEECPFGWLCSLHQPSLPDQVFICTPTMLDLCRPCVPIPTA